MSDVEYKLSWHKANSAHFEIGINLYLGKWKVANVFYSSTRNKFDPKKMQASLSLAGLKDDLGCHETEQEAKIKCENAVKYWLSKINEVKE